MTWAPDLSQNTAACKNPVMPRRGGGVCDVWFPEHRTIIDAVVPGVPLAAYVRG